MFDKLISSYKRGLYLQGTFGNAMKKYANSEDAIKRAVSIKYQNFLSRRCYQFICKTQSLYLTQLMKSGYKEMFGSGQGFHHWFQKGLVTSLSNLWI